MGSVDNCLRCGGTGQEPQEDTIEDNECIECGYPSTGDFCSDDCERTWDDRVGAEANADDMLDDRCL